MDLIAVAQIGASQMHEGVSSLVLVRSRKMGTVGPLIPLNRFSTLRAFCVRE